MCQAKVSLGWEWQCLGAGRRQPASLQGAAIAVSARDCPSVSAWSMVIALLITPEFMMPRISSSCEYCGTMVMLVPAAADLANAAMAALSASPMLASLPIRSIEVARGTGFSHSLPNAYSTSVLVAHL